MGNYPLQDFGRQLHKWDANVTAICKGKQPTHPWKKWQRIRQTEEEFNTLPWHKAVAVGVLNGSGYFRIFDIDAAKGSDGKPLYHVSEMVLVVILEAIGLPNDYQWSYVSGSGAGYGFVVRCVDSLPGGVFGDQTSGIYWGTPKEGYGFDHLELRWSSGQTIIDGRHPTGPGYRWRRSKRPFMPPVLITTEQVIRGFYAIAKPKQRKAAVSSQTHVSPMECNVVSYGQGLLDEAIQLVQQSPNGNRNNTLYQQTAILAEWVNGQVLERLDVEKGMMEAALQAGLTERETAATIASAFRKVGNQARYMPNGQIKTGLTETAVDQQINSTRWQIYTLHDAYTERPPQKFVVDGVIATSSLNIFYGSPGVLKSLVLVDMCADVASGGRWLVDPAQKESGIATTPTAVLWVDLDNGKQISDERFEAVGRARELSEDVPIYYVCLPNPPLNASDNESILMLGSYIREFKIGLVVIDNLGAITGGIDENSSLMAGVMANLRALAELYQVAVILIHHQSKTVRPNGRLGDSLRGHSSIEASLDLAMLVIREASSNLISLIATKVRRAGVKNLHAQFTYTHKPGTKELATARFLQVSVKDTSSEQAIQTAVLDVLKKNGKLPKGKLNKKVKATGITAGVQKIGGVIDAMGQQEMITVEKQGNGRATYFSLPTLTPL